MSAIFYFYVPRVECLELKTFELLSVSQTTNSLHTECGNEHVLRAAVGSRKASRKRKRHGFYPQVCRKNKKSYDSTNVHAYCFII